MLVLRDFLGFILRLPPIGCVLTVPLPSSSSAVFESLLKKVMIKTCSELHFSTETVPEFIVRLIITTSIR